MESPPLNRVSRQIFHVNSRCRESFQSCRALTSKKGRHQQDNLSSHMGSHWPGLYFLQGDTVNKPHQPYPVRPHQNWHVYFSNYNKYNYFSFRTVPLPDLTSRCWYVKADFYDHSSVSWFTVLSPSVSDCVCISPPVHAAWMQMLCVFKGCWIWDWVYVPAYRMRFHCNILMEKFKMKRKTGSNVCGCNSLEWS